METLTFNSSILGKEDKIVQKNYNQRLYFKC